MRTRREGISLAITALAAAWTNSTAQAQAPATASTLAPTGKLRAALIVSNPVLVTRHADGTLGGVSRKRVNAPDRPRFAPSHLWFKKSQD